MSMLALWLMGTGDAMLRGRASVAGALSCC